MANKNKKSKAFIDSSDDEPTSEFEVAPLLRSMQNDQPEIEVDAVTFDIEDHENEINQRSKNDLKTELKAKIKRIEELEFDVEQLGGKNRGLEEELKARVEIADQLHAEIAESQLRLEDSQQKINLHDRDTDDLKNSVASARAKLDRLKTKSDGFNSTIKNLKAKTGKLESELAAKKKEIASLEKQHKKQAKKIQKPAKKKTDKEQLALLDKLQQSQTEIAELKAYVDGRKDEWVATNAAIEKAKQELAVAHNRTAEMQTEIDERNEQLVRSREQYISASESLTKQKSQVRKLRKQNRELDDALNRDAKETIANSQRRIEEQAGELKSLTQSLSDIQRDRDQIAQQADELRTQLKDEVSAANVAVEMREKLESGLEHANATISELKEQHKTVCDQNAELVDANRDLKKDFDQQVKQIRFELGDAEETIANSQRRIEEQSGELNSLTQSLSDIQRDRDQIAQQADELRMQLKDEVSAANVSVETREKLESGLEHANATISELKEQHKTACDQNAELIDANRDLKKDFDQQVKQIRFELSAAEKTIADSQRRIENQSGELQGMTQSLSDIQRDRDQIAQYADELRMRLQDQVSVSNVSVEMREKFEAGLEHANATINKLKEQHKTACDQNAELVDANRDLKKDFDQQIRQIRFELGTAEETIAGHQTINEQLVSDLFDNRSFQQALETQLGEVEEKSNQSVSELSAELNKARQDAGELENELRSKDSVISELMQELSIRSDSIELKDDSENGLQKIDGFKTEVAETQSDNDRDRIARQLIGNADGKELRFPLFKNRLTIGRTAHNDIQLNMQYISRRHAVISSDHGQTRVIDWGSKNGVFVNNIQITEKVLVSGDIVTIGTTDFRYEERSKR